MADATFDAQEREFNDNLGKDLEAITKMNEGFVDKDEPETPAKADESSKPEDTTAGDGGAKGTDEDKGSTTETEETPDKDESEETKKPDATETAKKPDRQKRPERFIPMRQYHDEKRAWEQDLEAARAKVAELEGIVAKTPEGSTAQNRKIAEWAKENGYDEKQMSDLVGIIRDEVLPKETLDAIERAKAQASERTEAEQFASEWQPLAATLRQKHPNASAETLKAAEARMDEISHSPGWNDKDLDYILFKHQDEFDKILVGKPSRKGPETARVGGGGPIQVSAKDFNESKKPDFGKLDSLSESDREKIVQELNPLVYMAYINHLQSNDDGLRVNQNGNEVVLK